MKLFLENGFSKNLDLMPNCTRIKPKPYKICTSDFRYQITINTKTKSATNTSAAEPLVIVTGNSTVWAMQKSVNGEEIFNGTDIIGRITDEFYTRYNSALNLTTTGNITSDGQYYEIQEIVPNVEGRRQLTKFRCIKRGSALLEVNKLEI